jgi:hypothetical protein
MDLGESLAVYVDSRVEEERWISKTVLSSETESGELRALPPAEGARELGDNVRLLVKAFDKGMIVSLPVLASAVCWDETDIASRSNTSQSTSASPAYPSPAS